QAQRDAAPVFAGALHDRRLALELHARGRRVERGAVDRLPSRVRHLVDRAHFARARCGVADRERARVARAGAQPREVALQGSDLLVDGALLDLDALDLAVGVAAAAPEGLDDGGNRLRVQRERLRLVAFAGPRAERHEVVAYQLGGFDLDLERRLVVGERLDL